jgi:hypothetical protein
MDCFVPVAPRNDETKDSVGWVEFFAKPIVSLSEPYSVRQNHGDKVPDVAEHIFGRAFARPVGSSGPRLLVERHTDSIFRAPNEATLQPQAIFRDYQCEIRRHSGNIRYLQRRPGSGEIADDAVDLVTTVIDLRRLVDTVAGRNSGFDHNPILRLQWTALDLTPATAFCF